MQRLLLAALIVTLSGCTRPGDHPISANCTWSEADTRPLTVAKSADRRHLRDDAVTAEDVAIRWADKYFGHTPEYGQRRDECMEKLFSGIATNHRVDIALVWQYRADRDIVVDGAVFVSFGLLYAAVAYVFAGRIRRRFPPGEPGFWVMTFAMAIGISLVGVMVGILGSIVLETFLLNSAHLSYRMDRIPFRQHWVVLFVCGFAIFIIVTLIRPRLHLHAKA